MSYSIEICSRITSFLDNDDWNYKLDEEKEVIQLGLNLHNKMKHVDILFDLRDDMYMLFFTCPLSADEAERPEMRDLLNRINYGVMFGNFEMDDRDGEIRFRYAVDCKNQLPSEAVIKNSLLRSAVTFEKYGDAIVQVLMGVTTGKEAYKKANKDDD